MPPLLPSFSRMPSAPAPGCWCTTCRKPGPLQHCPVRGPGWQHSRVRWTRTPGRSGTARARTCPGWHCKQAQLPGSSHCWCMPPRMWLMLLSRRAWATCSRRRTCTPRRRLASSGRRRGCCCWSAGRLHHCCSDWCICQHQSTAVQGNEQSQMTCSNAHCCHCAISPSCMLPDGGRLRQQGGIPGAWERCTPCQWCTGAVVPRRCQRLQGRRSALTHPCSLLTPGRWPRSGRVRCCTSAWGLGSPRHPHTLVEWADSCPGMLSRSAL